MLPGRIDRLAPKICLVTCNSATQGGSAREHSHMVPVRAPNCLISLIWAIKAGAKDTKAPELKP